MRNVRFLAAAEAEANEATAYFDAHEMVWAIDLSGICRTRSTLLESILSRESSLGKLVRKFRLRVFRYNVVYMYVVDDDEIIIGAVAHHRRRTDYWRGRLKMMH